MTVYQLSHNQVYIPTATPCSNVYYYESETLAPSQIEATDLLNAWLNDFWPAVRTIQVDAMNQGTIRIVDLDNIVEVNWDLSTLYGLQVADAVSSFNALSFVLIGTTKATRKGHKRYAGYVESFVNEAGQISNGTYLTQINDLADKLSDVLDAAFTPVIFGGPTETSPNRRVTNVVSAAAYQTHTTQRSRGK